MDGCGYGCWWMGVCVCLCLCVCVSVCLCVGVWSGVGLQPPFARFVRFVGQIRRVKSKLTVDTQLRPVIGNQFALFVQACSVLGE